MNLQMKILSDIQPDQKITEEVEQEIISLLKHELYLPLMTELNSSKVVLHNSLGELVSAIRSGRIYFYRGQFKGKFSAGVSKELRRLGAKWDRKHGCFLIPLSQLPVEVSVAVSSSQSAFDRAMSRVDNILQTILPEEIADKVRVSQLFDRAIFRIDNTVKDQVEGILIVPEMTPEARATVAKEYTNNMKKSIVDFTKSETVKLRKEIQKNVMAGKRYEDVMDSIQRSYDVSRSKARFLARQETSLLTAKITETRYKDAGIAEYIWQCVAGSPLHPVRPMHKKLDGTIQRWDTAPVVNEKGERKHPKEDYGCRCKARAIVRFK